MTFDSTTGCQIKKIKIEAMERKPITNGKDQLTLLMMLARRALNVDAEPLGA